MPEPTIGHQEQFWNDWVVRSRSSEVNADNARRAAHALAAVRAVQKPGLRVLEVGCGSGWLSLELAKFGEVTATDLAGAAVEELKATHPQIQWLAGDFARMELPAPKFDAIVTLETIAHVPDQEAFAPRVASAISPGGTLVLTTQNEYIWRRTSWHKPPGQGQLRNWPSRTHLRQLFSNDFDIVSLATCAPGGNRGLPRIANNRISVFLGGLLMGRQNYLVLRERIGLGRSLVLVARRKPI